MQKPNDIVNWIRKHYPAEWDGDEGRCSAHRVRTYLARKGADMYYEKLNQGSIAGWRIRQNHIWRFENGGFQGRGMKQEEAILEKQKENEMLITDKHKQAAAEALAAGHPNVKTSMSLPGISDGIPSGYYNGGYSSYSSNGNNVGSIGGGGTAGGGVGGGGQYMPGMGPAAKKMKKSGTGQITGQARRKNMKKEEVDNILAGLRAQEQITNLANQQQQSLQQSQSSDLYGDSSSFNPPPLPSSSSSSLQQPNFSTSHQNRQDEGIDPSLQNNGNNNNSEMDMNMVQQAMQAAAASAAGHMDDLEIQLPIEMQMHGDGHGDHDHDGNDQERSDQYGFGNNQGYGVELSGDVDSGWQGNYYPQGSH